MCVMLLGEFVHVCVFKDRNLQLSEWRVCESSGSFDSSFVS